MYGIKKNKITTIPRFAYVSTQMFLCLLLLLSGCGGGGGGGVDDGGGSAGDGSPPNLIAHWDFEEGSGSTAYDSSGNKLNGTIYNAAYTTGQVVGTYALEFNGLDSYVEVEASPLLNSDSISIALWFKPRANQNDYADILDKGHGYGTDPYFGGYVFEYEGSSSSILAAYGNGLDFVTASSGEGYKDDQWHFIVANFGEAGIELYIFDSDESDESLFDPRFTGPGAGAIVDNDSPLFIGRHRDLYRYFNGLIDGIRIYDGPLSQAEVKQLYSETRPDSLPTPNQLRRR